MRSHLRPLVTALALLTGLGLTACGGEAPLAAVEAIPSDHLEVVRGDKRVADTTVDHLRELEAVTALRGESSLRGAQLTTVLADLKIDRGEVEAIEAIGADGYSVRLDAALIDGAIVVYADGDAPLPAHLGPLRLLTDSRAKSVRNLRRLVLNP
ncbi:MAG: hypothetical protein KC486_24485 [Myxococcales bacterium]|nr:hypothetical protein [Myxococcales bacterium]